MSAETGTHDEPRVPLTRGRVFAAAIELADQSGIDGVTMRNVAGALGVEAMSLYHHVANKEALLNGVVDTIVQEIEAELGGFEVSAEPSNWRGVLRTAS